MSKGATALPHKKDPAAAAAPKDTATRKKSGESDKFAGMPPSAPQAASSESQHLRRHHSWPPGWGLVWEGTFDYTNIAFYSLI
jgi:hypothetical protein